MTTATPATPRSVLILTLHCPTCDRHWQTGDPLTRAQAEATVAVLKNPRRGFNIVLCEPCWAAGNTTQTVQFYFLECPVH